MEIEIVLSTLLGTNIPHARYVSRLLARFFHLIPAHMPKLDTMYSDGLKQEKSKNHLARIQPEIVVCEKTMECKVS